MSYSSEVLADAPSVYHRLGESVGPTAVDSSGNAHDGTYTNAPTLGVAGALVGDTDTAVTFATASSQYVAPSFTFNQANATVEAWIKITGAPASAQLIAGCDNGLNNTTADKLLYVDTDGKLYFYIFVTVPSGGKTTSTPASTIPTGQWVHVVGVTDGANAFTYVNGVQVGSVVGGPTFVGYTTSNTFVSGLVPPQASLEPALTYFDGSIDEVAFYPSGLSAGRIAVHYAAGAGTFASGNAPTFNAIPFMGGH